MDTATQVLVIIVSTVLTIFLIVFIVLMVLVIKLIKQLKVIVDHAEKAVDSVSTAGEFLRNVSGPLALAKLIRNIMKHYKH
jgi:hypothetical protein